MRGILMALLCAGPAFSAGALAEAQRQYEQTAFEAAIRILNAAPRTSASEWELLGRAYYMIGDYKKSTEALEKAVALQPASVSYDWLGRAWGRRAETSSPFTAPGYASKARQYFEKAVALDPKNVEAMNDLMEYYLEAPGFLGGGFDKAAALAQKIAAADPVEGHYAQYRLAEKKKEFGKAEAQLRRAAEAAPGQVGRVLDLAKFLARQGRVQEADQAFIKAQKIAPESPKVMFARAEANIQAQRNLDEARRLLKSYLEAKLTPDDPPRAEARKLLRQIGG